MEVLIDNEHVRNEFVRWCEYFSDDEQVESKESVGLLDVLRAHFLLADYFVGKGYGIGRVGPRDPNLLHSAVYRQFVSFGEKDKWNTPFERCATLFYGLVKDHPFHDGNKRTGLLVMLLFLNKIGRVPTVRQKELEDLVVDIAENGSRKDGWQRGASLKSVDSDILFVADYLRRNSRIRVDRNYAITYREFDNKLRLFGYCLANPNDNFIDVCRIEEKGKYRGVLDKEIQLIELVRIGFSGWKKIVGRCEIEIVRSVVDSTGRKVFDSEMFYRGVDPLNALIAEYEKTLERLAFR